MNDTYIGATYQLRASDALLLRVGGGIFLPTFQTTLNNNKTYYMGSFNLSYALENFNLFAAYSYTLIGDEDASISYEDGTIQKVLYQNTPAWSLGSGYYASESLYVSGAYNRSSSIYKNIEDIQTLSLYGYYEINSRLFTTLSYAYGLSESASNHYIALRLGYFF